tara:strand:+ start:574 stop:1362 length:789 start_codon:yes stop_codon:yes gene_type:complete
VASTKSLGKFLEIINAQGGMSYSNNFDVEFQFKQSNEGLKQRLKDLGIDFGGEVPTDDDDLNTVSSGSVLKVFCEEAQLPNVQAATGTYTGRFLGEGSVNYAHTKLYTDFQLGWMCDANMTPLKFLNAWYSYIFGEFDGDGNEIFGSTGSTSAPAKATTFSQTGSSLSQIKGNTGTMQHPEKSIRLKFPDQYQCNVTITKSEKGKNSPNGRPSMMYTLMDCFPYAIDAVPLSYGASQVTKVTANFYYSKYSIIYNDIRRMDG